MIRHFDPIDILFIVLISCYLITFFIIVLFFTRKYLLERKINNKPFEELKLPGLDKNKKVDKGRKNTSKGKNKKKNTTKNSGLSKSKKNSSEKKPRKKPNNSKKSIYSGTKNTKKKKTSRTKNKSKISKKKLKK